MKLPSHWNQITVNQYKGLRRVFSEPSESITERYIDILIEVTEEDVEYIEDLPVVELKRIGSELAWLKNEPHKKYVKTIGDYTILDFKKVTWGMFIDLEHYYSKDYIVNMETICGILYRQNKVNEWGVSVIEPYEYDPIKRGEQFKELPITSIYGVVMDYLDHRNYLINDAYIHLFGGDDYEDDEPLAPEERKEKAEEERFNKWAFESITLGLANDDLIKMKEIMALPAIYVLNMLSMKADLK
jgi:hypothetical protein